MRAILAIAVLLALGSPCRGFAESPRPRYTTLVIEYTGEVIGGPAPAVVITTSQEEGEWYRRQLLPELGRFLVNVNVVPQSILDEITELPPLKRALENAKPVDNGPKTNQNARFTAGVGHDHGEIVLDKRPSMKILNGIDSIVANYPSLKSELQALKYQLH